jgi:hypothetical protein
MTLITTLPTPPSKSDPANFATRADAFLGALPAFGTQANALASEVNNAYVNTIAASASLSTAAYNGSTSYLEGATVWDVTNYQTYRRKSAGLGGGSPSSNPTDWTPISLNSSMNITFSGANTFSGTSNTFSSTVTLSGGVTISSNVTLSGTPVFSGACRFTGNMVRNLATSSSSLSNNSDMEMILTSNTNLQIRVRGSDGTTRVGNITLA